MISVGKVLLAVLVAIAFGLWKVFNFICPNAFTSGIGNLRGPKSKSWLSGHTKDIWIDKHTSFQEEWVREYGGTLRFKGFFNSNWLFTTDTRAMNHVLTHSNDYRNAPFLRHFFTQVFGKGIVFAEGVEHRQQRRIMNPAFGPAPLRPLTGTLFEKVFQLRDIWAAKIANPEEGNTAVRVNVVSTISRMTFDIIGLVGFNYSFDALNDEGKPNELYEALLAQIAAGQRLSLRYILQARFPLLRLLPSDRVYKDHVAGRRTMARIGKQLLSDAKSAALANAADGGKIEKNTLQGRDLLSLLVKANMASDVPDSQRLSDDEVLAQIPTFMVAGHGITSSAISWSLYAVSKAPEVQAKLREEALLVDTDTPSMEELMALPYLDAVVREALRMHAPIPRNVRFAMKDDVLPVEKPYTDKNGVVHNSIRISKGDPVLIPIQAINQSHELWGPDAQEFKPERWENLPEGVSQIPGVWGHILSFSGGPKACIGYRFGLVTMKAVLFTIVRAFEFELAVPDSDMDKTKSSATQYPFLRTDPTTKSHLPLLLKPYKPSHQN